MSRSLQAVLPPLSLIVACFLWGAATVLNKELLGPIPPVTLLMVQLIPGVALFGVLSMLLQSRYPRGGTLLLAGLLGMLNPGISYSLSMLGLERIPASLASLMWATEPLMILVLAQAFLREPVTRLLVVIVALGLFGVVLAVGQISGPIGGTTSLAGVFFMLLAVFLCAIYTVFSRRLAIDVDPVPLLAVQQGAGLLWTALLVMVIPEERENLMAWDVSSLALLVATLTGFMYYGLSYWLYLYALRYLPAAIAGSYFNIIPLVAIGLAMVFLGERLSLVQWTGAAMIMASALLLVRETLNRGRPTQRAD